MLALLQLNLHSQLNTWLQWIVRHKYKTRRGSFKCDLVRLILEVPVLSHYAQIPLFAKALICYLGQGCPQRHYISRESNCKPLSQFIMPQTEVMRDSSVTGRLHVFRLHCCHAWPLFGCSRLLDEILCLADFSFCFVLSVYLLFIFPVLVTSRSIHLSLSCYHLLNWKIVIHGATYRCIWVISVFEFFSWAILVKSTQRFSSLLQYFGYHLTDPTKYWFESFQYLDFLVGAILVLIIVVIPSPPPSEWK